MQKKKLIEATKADAEVVKESAAEAPKAEDTVTEGGDQ